MIARITAVNLKCGRLNQEINVSGNTPEQIQAIIDSYDKKKWLIIKHQT